MATVETSGCAQFSLPLWGLPVYLAWVAWEEGKGGGIKGRQRDRYTLIQALDLIHSPSVGLGLRMCWGHYHWASTWEHSFDKILTWLGSIYSSTKTSYSHWLPSSSLPSTLTSLPPDLPTSQPWPGDLMLSCLFSDHSEPFTFLLPNLPVSQTHVSHRGLLHVLLACLHVSYTELFTFTLPSLPVSNSQLLDLFFCCLCLDLAAASILHDQWHPDLRQPWLTHQFLLPNPSYCTLTLLGPSSLTAR
jgi:hypothetical protein